MKMTTSMTIAGMIWLTAFCVITVPAVSIAQSPKQNGVQIQPSPVGEKGQTPPSEQPDAVATKVKSPTDQAPAVSSKVKRSVPDPNRRWIMKQRDHSGKKIVAKPPKPLEWKNKSQQADCQAKLQPLAGAFDRARFYSIQGDRCNTARYAQSFLKTAGDCQKECPEGFLERNGYNEQVLRNMHQLKVLGTESCFGKNEPSAKKKSADPHKHSPSTAKQ